MMNTASIHDIYNQYLQGLHVSRPIAEASVQLPVHEPIGDGVIQRLVTHSGMEIVYADYRLSANHAFRFSSEAAMVELSFCLEGAGEVCVSGERHELSAGTCYLHFMERFDAAFEYDERSPMRSVAVGIPLQLFHRFLGDEPRGSRNFTGVLGSRSFRKFQKPIDPQVSYIVQQMLDCPFHHTARRLYLEGKALELLGIHFQTFLFEQEQDKSLARLSKSDLDKIREAGHILLQRMDCPPSLLELSRMVGLNDFKLKIGFKEHFGTTVFGYLRDKRMEHAMKLLLSGEMNVTQTAGQVGYANLSHFSEAFRKKFGINPSELLRRQ